MMIRRTTMNEYLISEFLKGNLRDYEASHNGNWYFSLENNSLYGGKILKLRNDMGFTAVRLTENNIEECAELIQQTLKNLNNIIEQEKSINEYCSNNAWTYSGT